MRFLWVIAFLLVASCAFAPAKPVHVPQEWWLREVSIAEAEEGTKSRNLADDPHWIQVKSKLRSGDRLLWFSAPPLQGPFGYVLVRDGIAIEVYYIGDS